MVLGRGSAATVGNLLILLRQPPFRVVEVIGKLLKKKREVPPERKTGILFEE
jgi:hypothetical protein